MNRSLVLDTNTLVSAALHLDGPPGLLIQAVLRRELASFTCPGVVNEYWDVLTRSKFARLGFPPPWFEPLLEEARHLDMDMPVSVTIGVPGLRTPFWTRPVGSKIQEVGA